MIGINLHKAELKQIKSQVNRSFSIFIFFLILVFLGLGTWQLQRKSEKEALLESLAQSQSKPSLNVDEIKSPTPFQPLYATGEFVPGKIIFLQTKVHQGKNGVYILNIFKTQNGHYLLIQRGWAPKEIPHILSGQIRIEGVSKTPTPPNYFQPKNTPPTYFWIDLKAISQDLNIPLLPYYLVAKDSNDPQILPTPPVPLPRNNHLEYALTWYSLAFVFGVMLLWCRKYSFKKEKL